MICPFCGTEMKDGFLQTGIALWSERKHKLSLNPAEGEYYALNLSTPLLSPHHIESSYCPNCHRMIVDCTNYDRSDR